MLTPLQHIFSHKTSRLNLKSLPKPPSVIRSYQLHISSQPYHVSDVDANPPSKSAVAAAPGLLFHDRTFKTHSDLYSDAKFEVIGSPFSLLSVSLSASQNVYTRRGTLAAIGGRFENV